MANRLEERLSQMHASQNYGGNIQLGPPTPDAPYGRIVIGNGENGSEDFVDTELLNFLDTQRIQPLTQIDTSWLAVAHVDEILSFVPRRRGPSTHAIWLNSPKLALDIIEATHNRYLSGLSSAERQGYQERPSPVLARDLSRGTSPVTALFRGKYWKHVHATNSTDVQEPARFYIALAQRYNNGPYNIHHTPWQPGPGSDRYYPAKMTIRELRYLESIHRLPDPDAPRPQAGTTPPQTLSTNEYIERIKLAPLREQLEDIYPNLGVVLVPTIYDITPHENNVTGAYTPNAVNLIIADNHLLIPKPFGPRVKPVDAVAILTEALANNSQQHLLSRLNERWLRNPRNHFLGVKQWFRRMDLSLFGSASDLALIAAEYKDGFPGMSETDRRQLILRHNRNHFRNEDLRTGWHELIIPEDTVDLFEVAIALAARWLGVEWRFVDSWSYHITSGEIHCGTNALRMPTFSGVPPWWDFYFRAP
jgi:hypothetical protein